MDKGKHGRVKQNNIWSIKYIRRRVTRHRKFVKTGEYGEVF